MDTEVDRLHPGCTVEERRSHLHAHIDSPEPAHVQACYQTFAALALERKVTRALVIGRGVEDALAHLAARDAVVALHVLGVPAGFRLALVPGHAAAMNGYRHAEIEGTRRGLRVRVFESETEALRWLTAPDLH